MRTATARTPISPRLLRTKRSSTNSWPRHSTAQAPPPCPPPLQALDGVARALRKRSTRGHPTPRPVTRINKCRSLATLVSWQPTLGDSSVLLAGPGFYNASVPGPAFTLHYTPSTIPRAISSNICEIREHLSSYNHLSSPPPICKTTSSAAPTLRPALTLGYWSTK